MDAPHFNQFVKMEPSQYPETKPMPHHYDMGPPPLPPPRPPPPIVYEWLDCPYCDNRALNKAWPIGHATIGMHQISIARYHANVEGPYEYKAKMARSFAESAIKKYMPLYCMQAGMSEQIATFMTNSFLHHFKHLPQRDSGGLTESEHLVDMVPGAVLQP
ncbi:uncharacterized protein EHS24_007066 [Apiotrichum porosum]|uniref:Uncharacterized protein n=1 Tax=Apiotrichum porosum TaxID=105984 RepID=A0A427XXD5_9TREE|nr:uncharacterized protein EHS24_007066 [Apiotrichum porosum]RSH83385.1 hypothetical protein EHS24_007066 [Apiotrichum porosum]